MKKNNNCDNSAAHAVISDSELAHYYQQRKEAVSAPEIELSQLKASTNTSSFKRKRSMVQTMAIFLCGGVASFGILAVISHLAKTPQSVEVDVPSNYIVIAQPSVTTEEHESDFATVPPLPPIPARKTPETTSAAQIDQTHSKDITITPSKLSFTETQIAMQLSKPDVNNATSLEPVFKVLPQYPASALRDKVSGTVNLYYVIAEDGTVKEVKLANKQLGNDTENSANTVAKIGVDKRLVKAAKKALTQWQFAKTGEVRPENEVTFDFKLADKK